MGDFDAQWLALREPADTGARSVRLARRFADLGNGFPTKTPRVLDLGCGTGANLRYLAPRMGAAPPDGSGGPQEWICVDRDLELLAALPVHTAKWAQGLGLNTAIQDNGHHIQGLGMNLLARTLPFDLAAGTDTLTLSPATLVTASALLDLVSDHWLAGLLSNCATNGSPLLLALTYDGRVSLTPAHPEDGAVIALVNAHQRMDKGFGPALGPTAPQYLAGLAKDMGFSLDSAPSDWCLGPQESRLQSALIAGWAAAAVEQAAIADPMETESWSARIQQWHHSRQTQVAAERSRIHVGHQDALLIPG